MAESLATSKANRVPYWLKIGLIVIGFMIVLPSVDALTYLQHEYDEIDVFFGCSYYTLRNFDEVLSLKDDTLTMDSKKERVGSINNGKWEWLELVPYTVKAVDKRIEYEENVCEMNNLTQKEECNNVTKQYYTFKDVIKYEKVWNDYENFGGKIVKSKNQIVRYCADIERKKTLNGFEISVDIVPKYDNTVYSYLNWWNDSWGINQDINITNNNATHPIEQGYSLNLTFDHASLVSLGQSLANGTDIRVVCGNVSIDRVNRTSFNTASTQIWFNWTGGNITASGSNSTHCKLFFDNPNPPPPAEDPDNVYTLFEDFDEMGNGTAVNSQRGWTNFNDKWIVTDGNCNTGQCAYFRGEGDAADNISERRMNHTLTDMPDFVLEFYANGKYNGGGRWMIDAWMGPISPNAVTYSMTRGIDASFIWFALDGANDVGNPVENVYSHFIIRVPRLTSRGFYFIEVVGGSSVSGTQVTENAFTSVVDLITINNEYNARAQKESWVDDIIVRRFLQDEPTLGLGTKNFLVPENISMLAVGFNITDFSFSSTPFVSVANVSFNISLNSSFIMLSSMNIQKMSGVGSNVISVRVLIDGNQLLQEGLRTVTSTSDIGSSGTSPILFNLSVGGHNIEYQFSRTGAGTIDVTNMDLSLIEMASSSLSVIRSQQTNLSYTHSALDFTTAFNWTVGKTENSSTCIISKQTVDKVLVGNSTVSYRYFDFLNSDVSPFWGRIISGNADVGSLSGIFIQDALEGTHNWSILSKQSNGGDTVNVNGTVVDFDMIDAAGSPIPNFQETNETTNESNYANFSAGTHLLVIKNVTVFEGDSYFLSMTTTMSSLTGEQTPTYFINSTGDIACRSEKERWLSDSDIGNAFIYFLCSNLTAETSYIFNLYLVVEGGEILTQMDESFSGFETTLLNITAGNLPPIPNDITNPTNGTNVSGIETITWLEFFDPNLDAVTYNITLRNLDGTINNTVGTTSSLLFETNWNDFVIGEYILMVEGCDPSDLCSNTTISIRIVTPPIPPLRPSRSFCEDNIILIEVISERTETDGVISDVITTERTLCNYGCFNVTLSNWGNPGCIESDFSLSLLLIGVVLVIVFSIRKIV